jgi:hypothetical protein
MPRMLLVLTVVLALGALAVWNPNHADTPDAQPKLLRHVVLFKFKADAKPEQIKAVEEGFAALPGKVKAVHDFEWGTNNSPEGLNRGYTHCFFVTFLNEADRQTYLDHPEHKKFVEILLPILEEPHVVDYWAAK